MALAPGIRLGHYNVTSLLGEGGMGQVWQATGTQLNRPRVRAIRHRVPERARVASQWLMGVQIPPSAPDLKKARFS